MRVWEGTPTSLPHASPHPRPDPIEWSEIPDEEVGAPLARPGSPARRRMLIRDLARAQGVKVTLRGMCALPTCSANGGQHGTLCPAKACALVSFGPHSKLFQRCTGFEKREHGLWKAGDHQPAAWYSFPAEGRSSTYAASRSHRSTSGGRLAASGGSRRRRLERQRPAAGAATNAAGPRPGPDGAEPGRLRHLRVGGAAQPAAAVTAATVSGAAVGPVRRQLVPALVPPRVLVRRSSGRRRRLVLPCLPCRCRLGG